MDNKGLCPFEGIRGQWRYNGMVASVAGKQRNIFVVHLKGDDVYAYLNVPTIRC